MAQNKTAGTKIRCPQCFKKDIDVVLHYDKKDDEYYCKKCCYFANIEAAQKELDNIKFERYKKIYNK